MSRIVFPSRRESLPGKVRKPQSVKDWARLHVSCWGCGTNYRVETHHIVGGSGRSDEPCNLFRACAFECHPRCEGLTINGKPPFRLIDVLLMKLDRDPSNFDLERLQELQGRKWMLEEAFQ